MDVFIYSDNGETMAAKIVFSCDRKRRNEWIAFGTTDMRLTEDTIIQLYGKR